MIFDCALTKLSEGVKQWDTEATALMHRLQEREAAFQLRKDLLLQDASMYPTIPSLSDPLESISSPDRQIAIQLHKKMILNRIDNEYKGSYITEMRHTLQRILDGDITPVKYQLLEDRLDGIVNSVKSIVDKEINVDSIVNRIESIGIASRLVFSDDGEGKNRKQGNNKSLGIIAMDEKKGNKQEPIKVVNTKLLDLLSVQDPKEELAKRVQTEETSSIVLDNLFHKNNSIEQYKRKHINSVKLNTSFLATKPDQANTTPAPLSNLKIKIPSFKPRHLANKAFSTNPGKISPPVESSSKPPISRIANVPSTMARGAHPGSPLLHLDGGRVPSIHLCSVIGLFNKPSSLHTIIPVSEHSILVCTDGTTLTLQYADGRISPVLHTVSPIKIIASRDNREYCAVDIDGNIWVINKDRAIWGWNSDHRDICAMCAVVGGENNEWASIDTKGNFNLWEPYQAKSKYSSRPTTKKLIDVCSTSSGVYAIGEDLQLRQLHPKYPQISIQLYESPKKLFVIEDKVAVCTESNQLFLYTSTGCTAISNKHPYPIQPLSSTPPSFIGQSSDTLMFSTLSTPYISLLYPHPYPVLLPFQSLHSNQPTQMLLSINNRECRIYSLH